MKLNNRDVNDLLESDNDFEDSEDLTNNINHNISHKPKKNSASNTENVAVLSNRMQHIRTKHTNKHADQEEYSGNSSRDKRHK